MDVVVLEIEKQVASICFLIITYEMWYMILCVNCFLDWITVFNIMSLNKDTEERTNQRISASSIHWSHFMKIRGIKLLSSHTVARVTQYKVFVIYLYNALLNKSWLVQQSIGQNSKENKLKLSSKITFWPARCIL